MKGTVRKLQAEKGFGFIRPESHGEPDRFFHRSAMNGFVFEHLHEGARVEFDDEPSERGPRACDVRVLDGRDDE